jgi:hypothetical protein
MLKAMNLGVDLRAKSTPDVANQCTHTHTFPMLTFGDTVGRDDTVCDISWTGMLLQTPESTHHILNTRFIFDSRSWRPNLKIDPRTHLLTAGIHFEKTCNSVIPLTIRALGVWVAVQMAFRLKSYRITCPLSSYITPCSPVQHPVI